MEQPILSAGDCTPHLLTLVKAAMAGGANAYEAINIARESLDLIAARCELYLGEPLVAPGNYRATMALPDGYKAEIDRVYGSNCCDGDA